MKILLTTYGEPRVLFDSKKYSDIAARYFKKSDAIGNVIISETGTNYKIDVTNIANDTEYINVRFDLSSEIDIMNTTYDTNMDPYLLAEVNEIRSLISSSVSTKNKEEIKWKE